MVYKGSCHCGRIAFDVEGELTQVIECNCSHCDRKGYLLWFVPRKQFKLTTRESDASTYTFNKHVIQHRFCAKCGCAPFGFGKDPAGNDTAAVNVRCLPEVDRATLEVVPYDGRSK
jgi:hypothetical protein